MLILVVIIIVVVNVVVRTSSPNSVTFGVLKESVARGTKIRISPNARGCRGARGARGSRGHVGSSSHTTWMS